MAHILDVHLIGERCFMIASSRIVLMVLAVSYFVGCSKVNFEKEEASVPVPCADGCVKPESDTQTLRIVGQGTSVDILFVNDNSGSMSFEQNEMADSFGSFVQSLDKKDLDYRIGIITTDVSTQASKNANPSDDSMVTANNEARAINQNGALQDGNLIKLSSGSFFITPSTSNREAMFAEAIRRGDSGKETEKCENYISSSASTSLDSSAYKNGLKENCASGDERGIFAANLTVTNNPASFIRAQAQLAIVILADEDNRSGAYAEGIAGGSYKLAPQDLPSNLISTIQQKYPGKSVSIHSIIIKPGNLKNGISVETALSRIAQGIKTKATDGLGNPTDANHPKNIFSGYDSACLTKQNTQVFYADQNPATATKGAVGGSVGYLYSLASKLTGGIEGDICAPQNGQKYEDQILPAITANIADRVGEYSLNCENPSDIQVKFETEPEIAYDINGNKIKFRAPLGVGSVVNVTYKCQ